MTLNIGTRLSGIWTRASDGARFDCLVTPSHKLECSFLQEIPTVDESRLVYTPNILKATIANEENSEIEGIYNRKGLIIWKTSEKAIWIKGSF